MEHTVESRSRKTRQIALGTVLLVLGLLLIYVVVGRRGRSIDRPYPVSDAKSRPSPLESLLTSLNLRKYPALHLDTAQETALLACINLAKLANHYVDGVPKFNDPQVRDQLLTWRQKMSPPFYAEFLLAQWYARQGEADEAQRWMDQALAHAPVVLIRQYQFMDGTPLAHTDVGRLGVECRMQTATSADTFQDLSYIDLTTDAEGRVFLPCYDTRIRCSSVQWPKGYEIETGRHGYLQVHARYNLLPTIYAWHKGRPRPPTDLPPSAFYDYKDAQQVEGLAHSIGETELSIDRCFRLDNDGTVLATDGRDAISGTEGDAPPAFAERYPSLDRAVIRLRRSKSSAYEILQVRLFDHRTRALLTKYHAPAAWTFNGRDEIAVKSFARPLPESVDVWFWLTTFDTEDKKQTVTPQVGATAELAAYKAVLTHLHSGTRSYSSDRSGAVTFGPPVKDDALNLQVAFQITAKGKPPGRQYARMVVVHKDGSRIMANQTINPSLRQFVCSFPMKLSDLDHFEFYPAGWERCFFFDGVRLPAVPDRVLADHWQVTIPTHGRTGTFVAPEANPARLAVTVLAGRNSISFRSNQFAGLGSHATWTAASKDQDKETHSMIVCDMNGLTTRMLKTEIIPLDANDNPLTDRPGVGQAWDITYRDFPVPASQIHAVRVRLSWSTD